MCMDTRCCIFKAKGVVDTTPYCGKGLNIMDTTTKYIHEYVCRRGVTKSKFGRRIVTKT